MTRPGALALLAAALVAAAAAPAAVHGRVMWEESFQNIDFDATNNIRTATGAGEDLYAGNYAFHVRFFFDPLHADTSANGFYMYDGRGGGGDMISYLHRQGAESTSYNLYGSTSSFIITPITIPNEPAWHTHTVFWDGANLHQYFDGQFLETQAKTHTAMSTAAQAFKNYVGYRNSDTQHLVGKIDYFVFANDFADVGMTGTPGSATPSFTPAVASFDATGSCTADDSPATPELDADASTVADGNLEVVFHSALDRYTATGWRFVGATDGACGDAASAGLNGWTHTDGECARTHKLTVPVTEALKECGFSAEPEDGGSVWYYEAVVEATTQEPNGTVFGEDTTRTVTTAFRVRVELPKSVDVSASAVAYGAVIQFALLSRQEVDTSTPTAAFKWTLVTSVQHPYELAAKDVTEESGHVFESLGLSLSAASVACPASGACTQTFEIAATESTSCELTGAQLKSVFTIGCRSQFTGACDTPEGDETDATFTVSTDSFCARVVEVATVTPTLTTSTSQGGASAADFVLQTTLFGRVTFAIEAGLSVTSTRLLSLDLVSEESVQPVTGAGVQDSAVVSAISFVESDQGGTTPHLDFQFQLNTDSVKFAVGGGQASLTITAVVEVTYDGAGSQRFEVSTEAVSGPGSVSTAASSTVGVSTPAAPGSASTAGSTVLGVSTGTAMVAGVGLVAVVALAAGAAVVARKRRGSTTVARAAKMVQHSSSSVELDIAPAGGVAASPSIATADLGNVQAAYDASQ